MKKLFTLLVIAAFTLTINAQSPNKMSYQSVVRNNSGGLITNQGIGMKISILQGSATGTVVFSETYNPNPQTNSNGLVTLQIGSGLAMSGSFSAIDWAAGPYFLKTETDPSGGTNYSIVGTSQLSSVPYALHAKTVESLPAESDPVFSSSPAQGITGTSITNWSNAYSWGNHSGLYRTSGWVPSWTDVTGKPEFTTVATSGSYNDLINRPVLFDGTWASLTGKPAFSAVATSGSFADLLSKPTTLAGYGITDAINTTHPVSAITATNISNWSTAYGWGNHANFGYSILPSQTGNSGKFLTTNGLTLSWASLSTVATTGSYNDLVDKPTNPGLIPSGNNIGDMLYWNGSAWILISVGIPGQYLQLSQSNIPVWTGATYASVTTSDVSSITSNTANVGGTVTSDGGAPVTSRGICYSIGPNPTIEDGIVTNGTGIGNFYCTLPDLTSNTSYNARAFATNSIGTGYGNLISFTTLSSGESITVTDVEGHIYNTVTIGTQTWMVENLKTSKWRNGDQISIITDYTQWPITTGPIIPAACGSYDFTQENLNIYGYLYNWFAVSDNRHLCPTGWHVPSDAEFQVLINYLGNSAGGKLKEAGTTHWKYPNLEGTNESGFTGLPGGRIDHNVGWAGYLSEYGIWWSSTSHDTYTAGGISLSYNDPNVGGGGGPKGQGNSVRCIKD